MAEITETVDSVEEEVLEETRQTEEPAAQKREKLYTEAELDARVKARIDKQRGRYEAQMSEKDASIAELTAERDALKAASELDAARNAASAETGVPASLLTGVTVDEINAQASAIKAYADSVPKHAPYADDGAPKQPQRLTRSEIAAIGDKKERKKAYLENLESLT